MESLNALRIAGKEIITNIRDVKMLIFMLATPVLLILILGSLLSSAFQGGGAEVGEIRVWVRDDAADGELTEAWNAFAKEAAGSGIAFEAAAPGTDVEGDIRSGRYAGLVTLTDTGIEYAGNERGAAANGIVAGLLTSFADARNVAAAIGAPPSAGGFVRSAAAETQAKPGALDYYAVAVTTMIILYGALTAGGLIEEERKRNTALRLAAAPVSKAAVFAGKVGGSVAMNAVFIAIVVLISKWMFGAEWGDDLGVVFLVLLSQIVFAISLGLGVSYVFKGSAAGAVTLTIVQLECFFGGAYTPTSAMTGWMGTISNVSPLARTNEAILQIIYADRLAAALPAVLWNVGMAALLLTVAAWTMRKREGL
ncbi:ABC transporter permease [Paenibacillus sp.]|uniref:ABC transporter permease n=1 Tax=Paenibacillus sp. TaxID=58172 RepID=UPI0028122468|nr:ABC transporter permease [Paenibacillus sp.]